MILNTKERKLARLNSGLLDTLSPQLYNMVIGCCILYGFIINALIVGLCGNMFAQMNYMVFLIGYVVCCIVGILMTRSQSPVMSFIGYNFVVVPIGAVLSVSLPSYAHQDILAAIITTGVVVAIMMFVSMLIPKTFEKMSLTLFLTLLIGIIAEIIAVLLGYSGNVFNWVFVIVFSLYVGYDWHKAQMYPKTLDNAIDSSLEIYLDIINLFVRLLSLFSSDDD